MAAFMPGASPPEVIMPMVFAIVCTSFCLFQSC